MEAATAVDAVMVEGATEVVAVMAAEAATAVAGRRRPLPMRR